MVGEQITAGEFLATDCTDFGVGVPAGGMLDWVHRFNAGRWGSHFKLCSPTAALQGKFFGPPGARGMTPAARFGRSLSLPGCSTAFLLEQNPKICVI